MNLCLFLSIQLSTQTRVLYYILIRMIKAPLTYHSPEHIYQYLFDNVGPLYMLIKNGGVIITFATPEHTQKALDAYNNANLAGFPLQLTPYYEGNMSNQQEEREQMRAEEPPPGPNDVELVPPNYSEFTRMVEEELQVKDPTNHLECITKKSRKDMVQFILSYNAVIEIAQNKKEEIIKNYTQPEEQTKKVDEFQRYYESGLVGMTKTMKQGFKSLRRSCANFEEKQKVDLDPNISISRPQPKGVSNSGIFKPYLHYSNEYNAIKRLAAVSETHFACTSHGVGKGKLLFFKLSDELIELSVDIQDGAYSLAVLDNHILVGNSNGSIVFLQGPSFSQPEISNKLHKALIFDIIPHSRGDNSQRVMTISGDCSLKLWNIAQENFTEEENTLFFEDLLTIEQKSIYSAVSLDEGQRIVYSYDKYLAAYDLNSKEKIGQPILCKGTILKTAALSNDILGLVNEKYISFVDLRNNAQTKNIRINKECRTLTAVDEFGIFYGCGDGEVGMLDRRNTQHKVWSNTSAHKEKIYDVCRMNSHLLSGDNSGQIVSWSPTILNK